MNLAELAKTPDGRKVIERVACLTSHYNDSREVNRNANVPLSRVLSAAWNPRRLADCLSKTGKPPRIDVSACLLDGTTWYVVSDGMHRSEAARNRGRREIGATIHGETPCYPERYAVMDGALWKIEGPSLRLISSQEPQDVLDLIVRLGGRAYASP